MHYCTIIRKRCPFFFSYLYPPIPIQGMRAKLNIGVRVLLHALFSWYFLVLSARLSVRYLGTLGYVLHGRRLGEECTGEG